MGYNTPSLENADLRCMWRNRAVLGLHHCDVAGSSTLFGENREKKENLYPIYTKLAGAGAGSYIRYRIYSRFSRITPKSFKIKDLPPG